MSQKIFISYRRDDSADVTGRIYDRLVAQFGKDNIFKDVDSIPFGVDFKEHLTEAVQQCDIQLVVIGRDWLTITDKNGRRRLDDPRDFVRIEIEAALSRNIPVIPLLVAGAEMPSEERLPLSLTALVYRNGTAIRRDPDFHRDMDRLIAGLNTPLVLSPNPKPISKTPISSITVDKTYTGHIETLKEGYGFINDSESSQKIFFYWGDVAYGDFHSLKIGDQVQYILEISEKGRHAKNVKLL